MSDPDVILKQVKAAVVEAEYEGGLRVRPEDLYIVWFSKTLQNWKALVSTNVISGVYWEVTHNGDKHETYVDAYTKNYNKVVAQ